MATAELVREQIEATPTRSFIEADDLPGSRHAVECELSRLVAKGDVARVRRGLYWKGTKTRIGMALPRAAEVGMAIAGPGAGPAGMSAVALLKLTTQVPAIDTIAVPGRVPTAPAGVRFVSRSIERRFLGLEKLEVAVLEVLRDGLTATETPWTAFADVVRHLASESLIRRSLISKQLEHDHHVAARQRWADLR